MGMQRDEQQVGAGPDAPAVADAARAQRAAVGARVAHCYRQLPISLAVNGVNGLILAAVLWEGGDAWVTAMWLASLLVVSAVRAYGLYAFGRAQRAGNRDAARWARRFVAGAFASGLVWGGAGVFLFHPYAFPQQVFLAFVVGGMVAGAIPILSALDHAFKCFAIPAVVPICFQMLAQGDHLHMIMGLMAAIFGIAMLATSAQVRRVYREAENLRQELSTSLEAGERLEQLVRLDALTGIPNRRCFEEELQTEWRRAEREGDCLAVVSADIDHFKEYNDRYGHPAGDQCLIAVAQAMAGALSRPGDVVARIGGEEFAFLLPGTTVEGAWNVAETVRSRILERHIAHGASVVAPHVTLSFGVASSEEAGIASPMDLLRASDEALYEAKRGGRDRVAVRRSASPR